MTSVLDRILLDYPTGTLEAGPLSTVHCRARKNFRLQQAQSEKAPRPERISQKPTIVLARSQESVHKENFELRYYSGPEGTAYLEKQQLPCRAQHLTAVLLPKLNG